jgi:putative FmdB family regulatory protein
MPRYDFRCQDCETVFEEKRSIFQASAPAVCPSCHSLATQKLLTKAYIAASSRPGSDAIPVPLAERHGGGGCGCGACACGAQG